MYGSRISSFNHYFFLSTITGEGRVVLHRAGLVAAGDPDYQATWRQAGEHSEQPQQPLTFPKR